MNPFFAQSSLPYQAPPFDRISDEHYQPAIEEGMRRHLAEIEAIAASTDEPTFEDTIEAMERTGALLTRVSRVFFNLANAHTNETIRNVRAEEAPRLAAHRDAIYQDPRLFARVRALVEKRDELGLDRERAHLLERYHRRFVRAGADLPEASRARLRELNQEEASLTTEFRDRVLAATNDAAVVVRDRARLEGLGDDELAAAAEAARERGLEDAWVVALQNTTQQPILASLRDRSLRREILEASMRRCGPGTKHDTTGIVTRLAALRAEKASLLGFESYAAYSLDDQMAKTPEAAKRLLTDLVPAATAKARAEAAAMQRLVDEQGGGFEIGPEDWEFYSEQVRLAEYDLDEAQIRPYLELGRVLRDGVFFAARRLYGLTFTQRPDVPPYHPDVDVYEVFDADGHPLALFYTDLFARPSKSGGAWMSSFVEQNGLTGTRPVVFNVCNFPKPPAGAPALLTWDHVRTLFHEFGHALHGMFSATRFPSISGTSVPRDFVEFPSQFNEHWALEPEVLANYARHYETGEPMPEALAERIRRSTAFNQGHDTTAYLAAALLDLEWHMLPAGAGVVDVEAFEAEALARHGVALPQVPPRYRTAYFQHVWGGGYASGYYAYLWSEVLDHDAFAWFAEHGGMREENGRRLREAVLSRGFSDDAGEIYRAFRGRDPEVGPLLAARGLG